MDPVLLIIAGVLAAVLVGLAMSRRNHHERATAGVAAAVRDQGWTVGRNRGRLNGMEIRIDGRTDRGHRFLASTDIDPNSNGMATVEFLDLRAALELPGCARDGATTRVGTGRKVDPATAQRIRAVFDEADVGGLTDLDGAVFIRKTVAQARVSLHAPDGALSHDRAIETIAILDALADALLQSGLLARVTT